MRIDNLRMVSIATAAFTALTCTQGQAYEAGAPAASQKSGITLGEGTAGAPPPGLYMFDQVFTYQTNLVGPGNQLLNPTGTKTGVQAADETTGFLWVPGWMFLGATYDAVLALPLVMANAGSPLNFQAAGINNTSVVCVCEPQLSHLGTRGTGKRAQGSQTLQIVSDVIEAVGRQHYGFNQRLDVA
jgi:hypothetical protein